MSTLLIVCAVTWCLLGILGWWITVRYAHKYIDVMSLFMFPICAFGGLVSLTAGVAELDDDGILIDFRKK